MWRSLGALALLVAANTASADFLYGSSNVSTENKLTINGSMALESGENQGWWSGTESNMASNVNYFVGQIEGSDVLLNNFFIFDISSVIAPVTSAVLQLQYFDSFTSTGATTLLYSLFDVTTEVAVLNHNEGTSWAIYNDLGSGKHYGSFEISTSLGIGDLVVLSLNGAALADLNAAIEANADHFAIGGTLSFPPVATPTDNSVPDGANTLLLIGLAVVCIWSVRNRKPAA